MGRGVTKGWYLENTENTGIREKGDKVGETMATGAATCAEGVALVLSEFSPTRALARVAQLGSSTRVARACRVRAKERQRGAV